MRDWVLVAAFVTVVVIAAFLAKGQGMPPVGKTVAEAAPAVAADKRDLAELRVVSAYKSAVIAQAAVEQAQASFRGAVGNLDATQKQAIKDLGLEEGTTFQVNGDRVTVIPPQKKAEKPAEKK